MALADQQRMYANSQIVQQASGAGGGNRYIPPTYNYRQSSNGPYSDMDWNNVQNYNLPQQGNNPFTQQYMGGLRESLGGFRGRYPGRQPTMPQFGGQGGGRGGFNPMQLMQQMLGGMSQGQMIGGQRGATGQWGGGNYVSDQSQWYNADGSRYDPTMMRAAVGITGDDHNPIYDSQGNRINQPGSRGAGRDYRLGVEGVYNDRGGPNNRHLPEGYSFDNPGNPNMSYTAVEPRLGYQYAYGPNGERIEVPDGTAGYTGGGGPNNQSGGQQGGGWQQMIMDFYRRMNPQQGGQQGIGSGEGAVKPGGSPYDKRGYGG